MRYFIRERGSSNVLAKDPVEWIDLFSVEDDEILLTADVRRALGLAKLHGGEVVEWDEEG